MSRKVEAALTMAEFVAAPMMCSRYADALIAIAAHFMEHPSGRIECWMCGEDVDHGCDPQCPGLWARRALGVG